MKRLSLSILSTAVIAAAAMAQHSGGGHSGGGGGSSSHSSGGGGSHFSGGSSHFGGSSSGGFHSYSHSSSGSSYGRSSFGSGRSYGGSSFGHTYSRSTGQSSYGSSRSYGSTSHSPSSYSRSSTGSSHSIAGSSRSYGTSAQSARGYSAGGHDYGANYNNTASGRGYGGGSGGHNGGFGNSHVGHFFGNHGGFWGGGWRSGYWGYGGWGAPGWFFGAYLFDPWAEPCVVSPWYYYPGLPPYIPDDDVSYGDPGSVNWQVDSNYDYAPEGPQTPLDQAIGDIVGAFNGENVNSINDLIPSDDKVAIYNDSKYMYSLSGKDFDQMMMDNLHDVKTISFNTTMVNQSGNQAIVKCKHVFSDPQGGQDIIYQMYRLQNEGGHYIITAFMTSQSQIHQDYF
jgi:hypothetical protein